MIPRSGPISLLDVLAELRVANPSRQLPISLGDPDVRALAGAGPSGPIWMSSLYGKSAFVFPITKLQFDIVNVGSSQAIRSGSVAFGSDGACTLTAARGSAAWFTPTAAGTGAKYFIKFVSQSSYDSEISVVFGQWYSLANGVTFRATNSRKTVEGGGSASIYFSTDGTDATIVASFVGALTWDVGWAS